MRLSSFLLHSISKQLKQLQNTTIYNFFLNNNNNLKIIIYNNNNVKIIIYNFLLKDLFIKKLKYTNGHANLVRNKKYKKKVKNIGVEMIKGYHIMSVIDAIPARLGEGSIRVQRNLKQMRCHKQRAKKCFRCFTSFPFRKGFKCPALEARYFALRCDAPASQRSRVREGALLHPLHVSLTNV